VPPWLLLLRPPLQQRRQTLNSEWTKRMLDWYLWTIEMQLPLKIWRKKGAAAEPEE
jgi:hypothetical protein